LSGSTVAHPGSCPQLASTTLNAGERQITTVAVSRTMCRPSAHLRFRAWLVGRKRTYGWDFPPRHAAAMAPMPRGGRPSDLGERPEAWRGCPG
jgi:hypothetical protein